MTDFWQAAGEWAGHAGLAGGGVLALGLGFAKLASSPALRQRIAAWTVRGAVLAAVLCLFPAWLTIPVPVSELQPVSREAKPSADAAPIAATAPESEPVFATTEPEWEWDQVVTLPAPATDAPSWWEEAPPARLVDPAPVPEPSPVPVALAPSFPTADVVPLLLVAYAVVAGALLLQLIAGHVGLIRLRQASRRAPVRVAEAFAELTADTNAPPDVLVSDRIESPVCFGLFRPAVVLPVALAKTATDAQLRWVLAHELDHLRRGDPLTGWWVGVARAVYFFVPWFWLLRKELHLTQEYLADAAAAAADDRAVDYAAFLVDLSGGKARLPLAAYAVRAGRSDLFRRVTMLLSPKAGTGRPLSRMWAGAAACGVLSAAVVLSGMGWAADDDPPPRKTAEKKVERKVEKTAEKAQDRRPADEPAPAERQARERDGDAPKAPREQPPAVAELKKAIAEAAKKGDLDEVQRLVDRLERTARANPVPPVRPAEPRAPQPPDAPRRVERVPEVVRPAQPPRVPEVVRPAPLSPDAPRVYPRVPSRPQAEVGPVPFPPGADDLLVQRLREEIDRATRQFDEAIEKMKDNPQAREVLQRARDEYKRTMEKANEAMRDRFRNLPDPARGFGIAGPDWFPGNQPPRGSVVIERAPGVRFGAAVSPVTEELAEQFELKQGHGVLVREVIPGTAAEKAGLKNDVIVLFAGKDVGGDAAKFAEAVNGAKAGEKVDVVILRKGKKETLKGVELPERPKVGRTLDVRPGRDERVPGPEFRPGNFQFRFPNDGGPRMKFEKMSVKVSNEDFEIDASKGETIYRVSGTVADGKVSASGIVITEGRKKSEYKTLNDVPEEHRAALRQLLGSVGGGAR